MTKPTENERSARLECAGCESFYDYRVTPDRSCPECGCPPGTVVDVTFAEGQAVHRRFIPNPAQPGWLANNGDAVSKAKRRIYQRDLMRQRRKTQTADVPPDEV